MALNGVRNYQILVSFKISVTDTTYFFGPKMTNILLPSIFGKPSTIP